MANARYETATNVGSLGNGSSPVVGWEDFPAGRAVVTKSLRVQARHLDEWVKLTGDSYPLHTDDGLARAAGYRGRIAHGPLTFALAVGLVSATGVFGDAILAWLGTSSLKACQPVVPGDAIAVTATVKSSRSSRKAGRGIVELEYVVTNDGHQRVMAFTFALLMRSREINSMTVKEHWGV